MGFNIDTHLYNLIYLAMGTFFSYVAVCSCLRKKKYGNFVANSEVLDILKKEIEMLQQQSINQITQDSNLIERRHFTRSQRTGNSSSRFFSELLFAGYYH